MALAPSDRLALVVRTQVTMIRAEQAKERAALLARQMAPMFTARGHFARLHQREPDPDNESDRDSVLAYAVMFGAGSITRKQVDAAAELLREATARSAQAVAVMDELLAALPQRDVAILDWCGVTAVDLELAVEQALGERGA
jgi:hypothetical protein